jgi:hypothetical protein
LSLAAPARLIQINARAQPQHLPADMRRDTHDTMWLILWYGWLIIVIAAMTYVVLGFE